MHKSVFLFFISVCFASQGLAQNPALSNFRTKVLLPGTEIVELDSLPVIASSLEVFNLADSTKVGAENYSLQGNQLQWKRLHLPPLSKGQKVEIRFRVFPYDLSKSYQHLDSTKIQPEPDGTYTDFNYTPYDTGEELINFSGLQYDGSYTNGISFGNSQSLVVNSAFNLSMTGTLGDDIEIAAAISDQNSPLQAEGNTQQLREFDRVFIQLKRKNSKLIAGDYELARPNSYFMNYYKKLQGATFSTSNELGKGLLSNQLSAAIARGKFARNTISQQEGNQGPYRLQGNEGETFIIILSGTEKVYLDGVLLTRGQEADYVIDYNRGDVTFTNRRFITKDSRIIIEFEYNDQNYLRSLVAFNTEYKTEKLRTYFHLYSEQDSKTSGSAADLDSLEKRVLIESGDLLNKSVPSLDTILEFSPFRVNFKYIDTLFNCGLETEERKILVYTANPDSAVYTATFSEVGTGMGNYILDQSNAANGRVYIWVAPDPVTCQARGAFEPQVQLLAPEQKQLFTTGLEYQLTKNSKVKTELALSNKDPNRFSKLDDQDDTGIAAFTSYHFEKEIGKKEKKWLLKTDLNYEFVQDQFAALNPYRPAEFNRDWNLRTVATKPSDTLSAHQHLLSSSIGIGKIGLGNLTYEFGTFLQKNLYTGTRHKANLNFKKNGFNILANGSLLNTQESSTNSRFFRPNIELSQEFKKLGEITLGVYAEREKNDRRDLQTDSLNANSFYWDLWRVFLKTRESEKISLELSYGQRYDYAPKAKEFIQNTLAQDLLLKGFWRQNKISRLTWTFNYRQLQIIDSSLTTLDPQETFLGRLEHSLRLKKGLLISSTNYEIGGGQEPLIEYRYLEVPRGEGLYFWDPVTSDFNGDGVPQINEIQESPFPDQANIIRVTLFTNQFIRTNNTTLNQSLRIDPKVVWHQAKGIKKFLSRFSTLSTLLISRKTREANGVSPWNPFQVNIPDSALVALNYQIQNTLFFKPNTTKYNMQLGQNQTRTRTVLTTGYQQLKIVEHFFRARWNKSQKFGSNLEGTIGQRQNDFQLFDQQDYNISFFRLIPSITFRSQANTFRLTLKYHWEEGQNQLQNAIDKATQHNFTIETAYNKLGKVDLRFQLTFAQVKFDGTANTPVELALLQGRKNGQNFDWTLGLSRNISQNLILSLNYNGRKNGTSRIVHVGSMEVGARF